MTENNEKDLKRTEIEDNEAEKVAGGAMTVRRVAAAAVVASSGNGIVTDGNAETKAATSAILDNVIEN